MRDSFRREYLGTWSELPEDPPHKQAYVPMCRHCKNDRAHHEQDHCLFDSTSFTPMPEDEWVRWYLQNTLIDMPVHANPTQISTSRSLTAQDIIQAHSLLTRKAWLPRK